ncbi:accessory factor UbiK family protein [Faunimonas sp. B44]|uniref:accessory factor UbiK family protein n=1 Tax=Faunimonas sp. B44 TaxID=3461493 RepID=UPI004044466A
MTQSSSRILDEFAKLMTDAAGVAQGVRREVETAVRHQAERFLNDMDLVQREDFEAVRETASRARAEADTLRARVGALEERLAKLEAAGGGSHTPGARSRTRKSGTSEAASEAGTDI